VGALFNQNTIKVMRRLNLKTFTLPKAEVLSRSELKNVLGGSANLPPITHCNAATQCSSGCAMFTNDDETAGTCSTCCLA
jgi:hypothetical protein